jgi:hypothetical protein
MSSERPAERRLLFNEPDAITAQEVALHDWHAEVAEYRLRHQGIKPELLRYLKGIGEAYR